MSKLSFTSFLKPVIRLTIALLGVVVGLSHTPNIGAQSLSTDNSDNAAPSPVVYVTADCGDNGDGGDGGDHGGDYCYGTSICTYFCPCGDQGDGGGDCYYGFGGGWGCGSPW